MAATQQRRQPVKPAMNISLPHLPTQNLVDLETMDLRKKQLSPVRSPTTIWRNENTNSTDPLVMERLYALLAAVADRVEMHKNVGEQRADWNRLLLTSINSITLAAATMAGIAAFCGGAPAVAMKVSSTAMYVAATGMLSIMNKVQPSQLAEERRNAVRLFKQIKNQIKTLISIGKPTMIEVKELMEKVRALDRAYPLPLIGVMLEKFPEKLEAADWWPEHKRRKSNGEAGLNGWNRKLEEEMKEVGNVMRKEDKEEYLRLGTKALNFNKFLAITGPVLTGLAAVGAAWPTHGGWAVSMGVVGGALASVVNTLEHGGQVGMVVEMYRSNAGFFKMLEEWIESNVGEEKLERRENGEVMEMKLSLQLGRSLSELRGLAAAKGECEEFASKLFLLARTENS